MTQILQVYEITCCWRRRPGLEAGVWNPPLLVHLFSALEDSFWKHPQLFDVPVLQLRVASFVCMSGIALSAHAGNAIRLLKKKKVVVYPLDWEFFEGILYIFIFPVPSLEPGTGYWLHKDLLGDYMARIEAGLQASLLGGLDLLVSPWSMTPWFVSYKALMSAHMNRCEYCFL